MILADLQALAAELPRLPDQRPQWLKDMPYVTQTGSDYYRFIWELQRRFKPERVLEIGIDKGGSTLSFSAGNPGGQVVSMDINKEACDNAAAIARAQGLQNLTVVRADSLVDGAKLTFRPLLDLVLLDSWHSFDQVWREYALYRPWVKPGGIILFDDTKYSKEMMVAWDMIPDPKVDLTVLHHSGFGACQVDHSIRVPAWESVCDQAKERYSR